MILKKELEEIAKINRLKPYQQEKHYIQSIILNAIYSEINNELIFKGGTSLFFIYGLNRFSEDLDFTMAKEIDLNKIMDRIKKTLELFGIKCNIEKIEDKNVSVSFRVGAEGPLFTKEIERCFVYIEISKREKIKNFEIKELKSLYKDLLPYSLSIMSEKEILAEKIRAIITRNQARDVYDLWFLVNKKVNLDEDLINEKLSYYKKKFNKKEFLKKLEEKKEIWDSELKPIIIGNLPNFKLVKKEILSKIKK